MFHPVCESIWSVWLCAGTLLNEVHSTLLCSAVEKAAVPAFSFHCFYHQVLHCSSFVVYYSNSVTPQCTCFSVQQLLRSLRPKNPYWANLYFTAWQMHLTYPGQTQTISTFKIKLKPKNNCAICRVHLFILFYQNKWTGYTVRFR